MVQANSPTDPPKTVAQETVRQQLKRLLIKAFRRTQGFLAAQALPHLANRVCQVYLGDAPKAHRVKCRRILRSHLQLDPAQLHRFFHTALGDTLLAWVERFFHLPNAADDAARKQALKALLVQMATDPEGVSLLSFVRRYPDTLQVNLDQILLTAKRVDLLMQETAATLATLQATAAAELAASPSPDFTQWPDLRQPGPFDVVQHCLQLEPNGKKPDWMLLHPDHARPLQVMCYQPHPWPDLPVRVLVQSHGLASSPEDLAPYAQHFASHGYFVAAPWHPGSDVHHVRDLLAGNAQELFQMQEFIDRPLDISHLLNTLEQLNGTDFAGKLDLQSVAIMGYSFGAYTAFALAGADIHFDKLETACQIPWNDPNPSLLLQCQALGLPRLTYSLKDDRIRAIISLDAVGSEVFGTEGMAQVQAPVLLLAGTEDIAAPLVFEQIRLFEGLTNPPRHLAVMEGKSHIRDLGRLTQSLELKVKVLPSKPAAAAPTPFVAYINALSLAFLKQHLSSGEDGFPPLSAHYGAYLAEPGFGVWVVGSAQ